MLSSSNNLPIQHNLPQVHLSAQDNTKYLSWIEKQEFSHGHQITSHGRFLDIIDSIPTVDEQSYLPLLCFSAVLERYTNHQSTFNILRYYTHLWHKLPEAAKEQSDLEGKGFSQHLKRQLTSAIGHLPSLFLSTSHSTALVDPITKQTLSHHQLSIFVHNFNLPLNTQRRKPVVVLALSNGFLLGLACLAVSSYYTAAPINTAGGAKQFQNDAELTKPQAILVVESDVDKLGLRERWVSDAGISILIVEPDSKSTFTVRPLDPSTCSTVSQHASPNVPDDFALILLTSGTSGKKKVVPVTTFSLLTGISCVIDSWGLSEGDSCINMMPLNHVGGLVRNLFAPILSGGSTILCKAFDPNVFWDIIEDGRGTWYYASPSMHTSILAEASFRQDTVQRSQLRLICNAAGGLLPALAERLKDTFRCTVLPSYGMTECMPISTPPLNYVLDRPGTSGVTCGPEIAIVGHDDTHLKPGQVGRICVRGGPTFIGYLQGNQVASGTETFLQGGWFDTGDLGYLDRDGYLYLTGRGKEVINRGGELISPFEIEEAITTASQTPDSILYDRVKEVLAFSVPHDVLQEVVGVVLVTRPGRSRPDLRDLNDALRSTLHASKLPVLVVYMNALPTNNNKIVRMKLAERLGLDSITDSTKLIDRHFEAECPPVNSSLDTKIQKSSCSIDTQAIMNKVSENLDPDHEAFGTIQNHNGLFEVFIAPRLTPSPKVSVSDLQASLYITLRRDLDGYSIPGNITYIEIPFPKDHGVVDEKELDRLYKEIKASKSRPSTSPTEQKIRSAMAEVLGCAVEDISSDTEFFDIGGDSLSAGRLLSILRRDLQIRIPIDQLFTSSKVSSLTAIADKLLLLEGPSSDQDVFDNSSIGSGKTHSSTNPIILLIHLLPIIVFFPMMAAFQWIVFMHLLSLTTNWKNPRIEARFLCLIAAMAASRLAIQIVAPIVGIAGKWMIIGRYREGVFPMWGVYHTRWWIVDKLLLVCEMGVFEYMAWTRLLYYRALGAKIGRGVTIEPGTILGEYDLLNIGDNVRLNQCICRPFACEQNASMYLGRIELGKNSSVGLKAHIAAGSILPEETYIGPNSSSYEMDDLVEDNRGATNGTGPKVHILVQLFVIYPIQIVVLFISSLPWMGGLFGILKTEPTASSDSVIAIIYWWATPRRIMFHYLAQALHASVRPMVWLAVVVSIKYIMDRVLGKATARLPDQYTQRDNFRSALMAALVPDGNLIQVTKLFGTHYDFTSMAVRALGGKVGKRVYWPGSGPFIQDFDLVDIGDDVVFGSRSYIVTTDGLGSSPVQIQSGAMIADRVVISPGSTVGRNAVLGSGALTNRDQYCADGTVWVGSKNGVAVCLSQPNSSNEKSKVPDTLTRPESEVGECTTEGRDNENGYSQPPPYPSTAQVSEPSTSSPFGRAFYEGKANYHVIGQGIIFVYSTFIAIFSQIYWNISTIATVVLSVIIKNSSIFGNHIQRPFLIFGVVTAVVSGIVTILSIIALLIIIVAKWILLGRRKPGHYDWDKSSYCQRWQVFLSVEAIRKRSFGGSGVLNMITGTYYIVLFFRALGATIGKDCALFAGGKPDLLFTEPDLLVLGDRVSIDDASVVSHINSRGNFSLRNLRIGSGSVLRSGSRLLSGAQMGERSCLLEHTLIMAGDVADEGTTYQGWPADVYRGDRLRIRTQRVN